MATLYIDNKPYPVTSGKNLLETCLALGFDLPYFCWHPALGSVGACRQCAIKVFKDDADKRGRVIMSCMEPVTDNQRISINDEEARAFRAGVIEWLMTNHPHDCAVCDEGGSCHLQDMTVMTGHAYRRHLYKKRTYRNQYLGPFINHEMNRCIQCYRCVRFYKDYAGGHDLDVFASKNNVYFGRQADGVLESEFSGNLAEVCPTGVFTDKTLKDHYTRKWDLTMAPSVCHHCGLGCNTLAGERYGSLRLINNRYNGAVNGYFLCDRGRFGYEFVNHADRIRQPLIDGRAVGPDGLWDEIAALGHGTIIGIGSARASLESNFVLKKLVGENNFYQGVSDQERQLASLVIKILTEGPVRTPPMAEVAKADAVFIIGEDVTNTAPMLALAIRQAVRQQPLQKVVQANIPLWNDAAARELIQTTKGPLFIAHVTSTKLDEIASAVHPMAPEDVARLAFAVAHVLDPAAPSVSLPEEQLRLAENIANSLSMAQRPVIISGTSSGSATIIQAAANIAMALHRKNSQAGIVYTVPECNSMGLSMLGGKPLHAAFQAMRRGEVDTLIVLENNLFRHEDFEMVRQGLERCKQVILLDHTLHGSARYARIIIPAGTFAESDGTLINNEGRAQRFFQVYAPAQDNRESWRLVLRMGSLWNNTAIATWTTLDDIIRSLAAEHPMLGGVANVTPTADYRVNGQKIPREPHRFSGRTAMNAHIQVSEAKPPVDPDSPLSYTMEGLRGMPPSSMIPFFWSPGWNSVQSVNKYQESIGGALRGGDPGIRLLAPRADAKLNYFQDIPERFEPLDGHLWMVPRHHIYGSDELSVLGVAVGQRVPPSTVDMNVADAAALALQDGSLITVSIDGQKYTLPVKTDAAMPRGVASLPMGFPDLPYRELPGWGLPITTANQIRRTAKQKQYE